MRKPTIGSIMIEDIVTVDADSTVAEAARILREANVGSLLVGDPPDYDGILSERDIVYKAVAENRNPDRLTADDIMTRDITYAYENDPIDESYELMIDNGFRHLPIKNNREETVGIVSIRSLFSHRDETSQFRIEQLQKYIRGER